MNKRYMFVLLSLIVAVSMILTAPVVRPPQKHPPLLKPPQ